eukprot:PhF_6_TR22735/c0_g1_i3/m.32411
MSQGQAADETKACARNSKRKGRVGTVSIVSLPIYSRVVRTLLRKPIETLNVGENGIQQQQQQSSVRRTLVVGMTPFVVCVVKIQRWGLWQLLPIVNVTLFARLAPGKFPRISALAVVL